MVRRATVWSAVVACALVAGCSTTSTPRTLRSAVRDHAVTAGQVMTQVRGPLPARAAALAVAGHTADTTVQALTATGTTWGGVVTLRIEVADANGDFGSDEHATGCFTYRFAFPRDGDYGIPHEVVCGSGSPLDLTSRPLPTGVDAGTRATVVKAIARVAAPQRGHSETVHAALAGALGADYTITSGAEDRGVFTWVRYGDECLTAQTSPTEQRVSGPMRGPDCDGG